MHAPWKECYGKPDNVLKSRDIILLTKVCMVKTMIFPVSHVQMWELDHKQGWASKNWCFQTVVLEKILESPSDSKEIKPLNPKGNQPWIFIGRVGVEIPITLATWCEELTHWERPWCQERLRAGEGGDRGWDGWMASPTQWTWIWASSGRHWTIGEPDVLESQRVRHDLATK